MDDLAISLISKELTHLLAADKIKTFQKAVHSELKDQHKIDKIAAIKQKYDSLQMAVDKAWDMHQNIELREQVRNEGQDSIDWHLSHPSIIQITGNKGIGKTLIGLELCKRYLRMFPLKSVKIINCTSGITGNRLFSIQKVGYVQYCDAVCLQEALQAIKRLQKQKESCLVMIDGLNNLLMAIDNPKPTLLSIFNGLTALVSHSCSIILTSYTHYALFLKPHLPPPLPPSPALLNPITYHAATISQWIDLKLMLFESEDGKRYAQIGKGGKGRYQIETDQQQNVEIKKII